MGKGGKIPEPTLIRIRKFRNRLRKVGPSSINLNRLESFGVFRSHSKLFKVVRSRPELVRVVQSRPELAGSG